MKYKHIKVQWWDAASKAEWASTKELPHLQRITTAGYLVRKTKTSITICASIHHEDDGECAFGDCVTIPAPWIKKTNA